MLEINMNELDLGVREWKHCMEVLNHGVKSEGMWAGAHIFNVALSEFALHYTLVQWMHN